jgi:hypothetical protein
MAHSAAIDPKVAAALDAARAAVAELQACGDLVADARDAITVVREVEALARSVRSCQVGLVAEIEGRGLHQADGHASAKVMVRHVANLSEAEAARRARSAKALRDLPAVAEAFAAGRIGGCQVERMARTHANPRVRDAFLALDEDLAVAAARATFRELDLLLANWEQLEDEDGARDRNQRNHEHRDAAMVQDPDGSWRLVARFGALQGAEARAVFDAFIEGEFAADWAEARAQHGDATSAADLARTDAQRRADALARVFERAAACRADAPGGTKVVTNVVMDHETWERQLRRLAGQEPEPFHPGLGLGAEGHGAGRRCTTLNGHLLDPTEATVAALLGHVRRVVVGADSVVIDLGRTRRLFTGAAQLAARLTATTCYWPGCHVPVGDCQTDHLVAFNGPRRGRTDPGNGGPACGRHNRHKEHGFSVHRDRSGALHVYRPDGSEISGGPRAN